MMFYADKSIYHIIAQAVMGGYFIVQGIKNMSNPVMILAMLEAKGYRYRRAMLTVGLGMIFSGGTLILIDYQTRYGAIILIIFTLLATVIFHRWWTVEDPAKRPYAFLFFFYNVYVGGALLLLL